MHTERRQIATCTLALLLLMSATTGPAAEKLATPRLEDRVTDLAQVFPADRRKQLIDELAAYERETTNQIAILTIPTLSGEDIDAFSLRVANEWGIGQKDRNNGILIVLAMQERRVRIEVGLGLESSISNEKAQNIIQSEMIPAFRKGDYAGGLEKGTHRLMQEARSRASSSFLECRVEARRDWRRIELLATVASAYALMHRESAPEATTEAREARPSPSSTRCPDRYRSKHGSGGCALPQSDSRE